MINFTSFINEWFPFKDYNLILRRSQGLANIAPVEPDNKPAVNFVRKEVFYSLEIRFLYGS